MTQCLLPFSLESSTRHSRNRSLHLQYALSKKRTTLSSVLRKNLGFTQTHRDYANLGMISKNIPAAHTRYSVGTFLC